MNLVRRGAWAWWLVCVACFCVSLLEYVFSNYKKLECFRSFSIIPNHLFKSLSRSPCNVNPVITFRVSHLYVLCSILVCFCSLGRHFSVKRSCRSFTRVWRQWCFFMLLLPWNGWREILHCVHMNLTTWAVLTTVVTPGETDAFLRWINKFRILEKTEVLVVSAHIVVSPSFLFFFFFCLKIFPLTTRPKQHPSTKHMHTVGCFDPMQESNTIGNNIMGMCDFAPRWTAFRLTGTFVAKCTKTQQITCASWQV